MSDYLFLDIETAALTNLPEPPASVLERGMGNRVKPEAIAAKVEENRRGWTHTAALDWRKGKVIAFGWWVEDVHDNAQVHTLEHYETEAALLERFWGKHKWNETVVGFNIRQFDLPFLIGRSAACGVRPTRRFNLARYRRDLGVIDLMEMLSFDGAFDLTGWSLANYCEYFGLESKPYGEGKDVAEWYANGQWDEIARHLEADVLMTRDLFNFAQGAFL